MHPLVPASLSPAHGEASDSQQLLPISSLPRSSLPRMHTMPCVIWPMLVTRLLVSTGPSGPRKLGKSLIQASGVCPRPGTLTYSSAQAIPGLDIAAPKGGDSWATTLQLLKAVLRGPGYPVVGAAGTWLPSASVPHAATHLLPPCCSAQTGKDVTLQGNLDPCALYAPKVSHGHCQQLGLVLAFWPQLPQLQHWLMSQKSPPD